MLTDPLRESSFVHIPGCKLKHRHDAVNILGHQFAAIQRQKKLDSNERRAFIAI